MSKKNLNENAILAALRGLRTIAPLVTKAAPAVTKASKFGTFGKAGLGALGVAGVGAAGYGVHKSKVTEGWFEDDKVDPDAQRKTQLKTAEELRKSIDAQTAKAEADRQALITTFGLTDPDYLKKLGLQTIAPAVAQVKAAVAAPAPAVVPGAPVVAPVDAAQASIVPVKPILGGINSLNQNNVLHGAAGGAIGYGASNLLGAQKLRDSIKMLQIEQSKCTDPQCFQKTEEAIKATKQQLFLLVGASTGLGALGGLIYANRNAKPVVPVVAPPVVPGAPVVAK